VDGWHTFDHTLLDFFYINRMLNVNGVVVFDDADMPAVRKCVRYIASYPAYGVLGQVSRDALNWKWRLLGRLRNLIRSVTSPVGPRLLSEFFDQRVLTSDRALGIDATMVALLKESEDSRSYDWYSPF
jgi:hypothetical protein